MYRALPSTAIVWAVIGLASTAVEAADASTARLYGDGSELARFSRRWERLSFAYGRGRRFGRVVARWSGSFVAEHRRSGKLSPVG